MFVSLIVLPGAGQRDVQLRDGATIADLVRQESLTGRQIVLNGNTVDAGSFGRALRSGDEVAALSAVKGA